jgi:hypothetical protein
MVRGAEVVNGEGGLGEGEDRGETKACVGVVRVAARMMFGWIGSSERRSWCGGGAAREAE